MSQVYSGQSSSNVVLKYLSHEYYMDLYDVYLEKKQNYYDSFEGDEDNIPEYPAFGSYQDFLQQEVHSGGYAFSTVVSSGCRQIVSAGGSAASTIVSFGGRIQIQGQGAGALIHSGGFMDVLAGGAASGGAVSSGGRAAVSSGGSVFGMSFSSGARMSVLSGGTAIGVALLSGAAVDADAASGTFISGTNAEGGKMLLSGGTASGFVFSSGGCLRISSGGAAVGAKVLSGASLSVGDAGAAFGASVASGGVLAVAGGSASGTKLLAGAKQVVSSGIAENTDAASGAKLIVDHGGSARTAAVAKGGLLRLGGFLSGLDLAGKLKVSSGGRAEDVRISGGKLFVLSGGLAQGASVCRTGSQVVSAGGTASETTLSGGMQIVEGRASGAKLLAGASQLASGSRALASGAVLSGARQTLAGGARAVQTSVKDGWQFVKADGIASGTRVLEDGQQIVYAEGIAVKTTVSSGGLLTGKEGACLSCTALKSGAEMTLASGSVLEGANAFTGAFVRGGTSSRPVRLAKGASLAVGAKTDMSKMHLKVAGAFLTVSGAGNRLASLTLDAASKVDFDISKLKARGTTPMLSLSAKNTQKTGAFSVSVGAAQGMGVYELSQNVVQAKNTAWSVRLGSAALGTAKLNGAGFSKNGVSYSLTAAKNQICLVLTAKAGKMLKGTSKGETLSGGADSDVFWAGAGNDVIRGSGGRDCAVYGKENWGQDTVAKTSGTLALVFRDLKAADVTSSLSGTVMTFAKKADAKQTITVKGWSSATHSVVFGGTMSAVTAWAKAASPTNAQLRAARTEVWKKAGLAAA